MVKLAIWSDEAAELRQVSRQLIRGLLKPELCVA